MTTTVDFPFLAITNANGWGRGASADEAKRNAMKNSTGMFGKPATEYTVHRCHPGTYVCQITGGLLHAVDHPPVKVVHKLKRGTKWVDRMTKEDHIKALPDAPPEVRAALDKLING